MKTKILPAGLTHIKFSNECIEEINKQLQVQIQKNKAFVFLENKHNKLYNRIVDCVGIIINSEITDEGSNILVDIDFIDKNPVVQFLDPTQLYVSAKIMGNYGNIQPDQIEYVNCTVTVIKDSIDI